MKTQHERILDILQECGKHGMNSFQWRNAFIQLPVRIKELKALGYLITTKTNKNRSVNYILLSHPKTTPDFKKADEKKFVRWEYSGNVAKPIYG